MEGETGVSKTALTRMLFALKNGACKTSDLRKLVQDAVSSSQLSGSGGQEMSVLHRLAEHWQINNSSNVTAEWNTTPNALAESLCATKPNITDMLLDELRMDPSLNPLGILSTAQILAIVGRKAVFKLQADFLLWYTKAAAECGTSSGKP
jgi:hypothetical protein